MKKLVAIVSLLMLGVAIMPAAEPQPTQTQVDQVQKKKDKKKKKKDAEAEKKAEETAEKPKKKEKKGGIKPYEEVITEEAKSDEGIFKVHRIEDKLFFEIPASELGTEFVLVNRIARNANGAGYGGDKFGSRVVRWVRNGDKVLFQSRDYSVVADPDSAVAKAVENSRNETVIMSFPIKALGPEEAPVIEVTSLYTTDVYEMSAKSRLQARSLDKKRSFLDSAMAFPNNIEVRATHTYTRPPSPPSASRRPQSFRRGMSPGNATLLMHYSMVKLPDDPMKPRIYDPRVGYFTVRQLDYSSDEHYVENVRYITRWRLEKKNPGAALSDPVKPIVYYVDPATPEKWVPYMISGVEKWQTAFEAAGFTNAIIAKEAPSPEEDPEWHPEDARYSVIRWLSSTIQNAQGPHVHDPRTGEILESDIRFFHNIQRLLRSWYFTQVGPLDPRAQDLPLPDELMGLLIEYVVAHEVGHTLGFQHNMLASSTYPLDKIRDPEFLADHFHTPTLMDYSRFNYVAQPEDNIPVELLIPGIGPYDKWATMWGYKPIPSAKTAEEEKATLDAWARQQDDVPHYRFSTEGSWGLDPGNLTEAVGDADAVAATTLAMKNLNRVADMLLEATEHPGEPWDDLEDFYGALVGQWARVLNHVVPLVGGYRTRQIHGGQQGVRFAPVSEERQREAVDYMLANAFQTPEWLIDPQILRRIEAFGALNRIGGMQSRIMFSLISNNRVSRLIEQEAMSGNGSYTAGEFLSEVRAGIWSELDAGSVSIDPYRRNVQRAYLGRLSQQINSASNDQGDARAMLRGELRTLDVAIEKAIEKAADNETRYHLQDARDRIEEALDPEKASSAGAARSFAEIEAMAAELEAAPTSCWPGLDEVIHQ